MQSYESFGGYPLADLDRKNLEDVVQELISKGQPIPVETFVEYTIMIQEEAITALEAVKAELRDKTENFHQEVERQDKALERIHHLAQEIINIHEVVSQDKDQSTSTNVLPLHPKDNS